MSKNVYKVFQKGRTFGGIVWFLNFYACLWFCATKYRSPVMPGLVTVSLRQKNDARLQQLFCQKHSAVDIPAGNTPSASLLFCHGRQMEKIWHCAPRTFNLSSFTSVRWKTFSLPLHFHFFLPPFLHAFVTRQAPWIALVWFSVGLTQLSLVGAFIRVCVWVCTSVYMRQQGVLREPLAFQRGGMSWRQAGSISQGLEIVLTCSRKSPSWSILWFSKCSRNSFRLTLQSRLAVRLKVTLSRGPSGSASVERKI